MGMSAMFGNYLFWGILALAVLLLALGLFQFARPHYNSKGKRATRRFAGFMTILSGLLLGAFGLFAWVPQMASFSALQSKFSGFEKSKSLLNARNAELSGLLKSRDGEIGKLRSENASLLERLKNRSGNSEEITRLNGVIARLNEDRSAMVSENTRLKGLLSANRTDSEEITRLNGVINRLGEDNSTLKQENTRLKGLLSTNRTDSEEITRLNGVITRLNKDNDNLKTENDRIKGLLSAYRNDSEVQNAKIASLEAELAKLRNRPVATAPSASTKTVYREAPLSLIHQYNHNNADLRLTSKDYVITKMGRKDLVRGKNGHYYNILIKNPATGKGYNFASASYSRVEPEESFKASLDKVISDIKNSLDGRRNYQLFVRGKASAGRYLGKPTPGYEYNDIKVLEEFRGRYDNEVEEYIYGPMIKNEDLPNLRGAYLQELIAKNYKVATPIILDGKVSSSRDPAEQAVALILYVEE